MRIFFKYNKLIYKIKFISIISLFFYCVNSVNATTLPDLTDPLIGEWDYAYSACSPEWGYKSSAGAEEAGLQELYEREGGQVALLTIKKMIYFSYAKKT